MVWAQVAVRVCPSATSFATAVSVSHAACATAAGLNAPHAVRLVAQFVVCGVSAHESHAAAAAQHCGRSMPPRKCDMTARAHGVVLSHPLCMPWVQSPVCPLAGACAVSSWCWRVGLAQMQGSAKRRRASCESTPPTSATERPGLSPAEVRCCTGRRLRGRLVFAWRPRVPLRLLASVVVVRQASSAARRTSRLVPSGFALRCKGCCS